MLLEPGAFEQMHGCQELGYPFSLAPLSYAACIGASGGTPQALATIAWRGHTRSIPGDCVSGVQGFEASRSAVLSA